MRFIILFLLSATSFRLFGQACTRPGQSPTTAFPLCGQQVFSQNSVPLCGGTSLPGACMGVINDKNPFYYKFTCRRDGDLGFVITPNVSSSDYDWQLFDITGRNPNDIFNDGTLTVACNWSGELGNTGASSAGTALFVCEGLGKALFSSMPQLKAGRQYLLLVSHFSNNQSGYNLVFQGGTADITDDTPPSMSSMRVSCNNRELFVKLSKKVRCTSIQTNGSDFFIPNGPAIASVEAIGCATQFDTDSVNITLAAPLPAGTYQLLVKKGSDDNTILDFCNNPMPENHSLVMNVEDQPPPRMDSVNKTGCAPTFITVNFPNAVQCNSVAPDGSDFSISGPQAVSIVAAAPGCSQNNFTQVQLQLSQPIINGGRYTITLRNGSDGNTLLSTCDVPAMAGNTVSFDVVQQPSIAVTENRTETCTLDALQVSLTTPTPGTTYQWIIDGQTRPATSPLNYSWSPRSDRQFTYALTLRNAVCADTIPLGTVNTLRVSIKAGIDVPRPAFACPGEAVNFKDSSSGGPVSWQWNFGQGTTSNAKDPAAQTYPPNASAQVRTYRATLQVTDADGCTDTTSVLVSVPNNCRIEVPTGFTPNADGRNDFLYPLNAWKATDLRFEVYNRYGQLVWQTADWTRRWDGRVNGSPAPVGTYVWFLRYTNLNTGERKQVKGTTVLVR